uniref:Uncharacterized protein n=1 Tax=Lepeophtheirus salmonis TaxID=72036 RepID=A0A0K2U2Z2_LEPSM
MAIILPIVSGVRTSSTSILCKLFTVSPLGHTHVEGLQANIPGKKFSDKRVLPSSQVQVEGFSSQTTIISLICSMAKLMWLGECGAEFTEMIPPMMRKVTNIM